MKAQSSKQRVLRPVEGMVESEQKGMPEHGGQANWDSAIQPELQDYRGFNVYHVFGVNCAKFSAQTLLAHGGQLVSHCFSSFAIQVDVSLTGIEPICSGGDWNNLNAVQSMVRGII